MRKLLFLAAVAATFGVTADRAEAQPTEAFATATLTVGSLLFVNIDVAALDFAPTSTDFSTGSLGGVSNQVATKGNVPYELTIEAEDDNFVYAGLLTPPAKPSTELRWSANGGAFTGLTNAAQEVDAFVPGQYTTNMSYEVELQWDEDLEGIYTLPIKYTVVAQ
ncbi:MAG: hypothetical protein R6X22_07490 [Gemmatimonadota bacterium]